MALEPHRLSALRIALNECAYFESRFPALKDLRFEKRLDTAEAIRQIYIEQIKLMDQAASGLARMEMYRDPYKRFRFRTWHDTISGVYQNCSFR